MNDLARHVQRSASGASRGLSSGSVARTLAAICEPHASSLAKRDAIIGLLSDAEVARVSRAEDARLVEGDTYIDLEDLDSGVHQVNAKSRIEAGQALPRSAVSAATWAKIVHVVAS
jgi:hypothetical protein